MDTFIGSLIIIFIVLVILLSMAAFAPYYPDGVPPGSGIVLHSFTAGTIGFADNYVSRTQNLGSFGVGVPQDEVLKSVTRMEITAGVFGGSSEEFTISVPQDVLDWLKDAEITFNVEDTNQYGNLVIKWNGAELFNKKADRGGHTVPLGASRIKEQNTLEIAAQGPGLLFWAATLYDIRNFRMTAEYGPAKFVDFEVSTDELESLDRFNLGWFTATRRGTLTVKVNGEDIFSGLPDRQESIDFTDTGLQTASVKPGKNRLTFMAFNGSFELQDVIMKTYVSKNQRTMKEQFQVTATQLNSMKSRGGIVKIYVKDVEKEGTLRVKVNEEAADPVLGKVGWNRISFSGDLVESGSNWLEIGGTGTFDVGEVSVEVA